MTRSGEDIILNPTELVFHPYDAESPPLTEFGGRKYDIVKSSELGIIRICNVLTSLLLNAVYFGIFYSLEDLQNTFQFPLADVLSCGANIMGIASGSVGLMSAKQPTSWMIWSHMVSSIVSSLFGLGVFPVIVVTFFTFNVDVFLYLIVTIPLNLTIGIVLDIYAIYICYKALHEG